MLRSSRATEDGMMMNPLRLTTIGAALGAAALFAACAGNPAPGAAGAVATDGPPLACDDQLKTAFRPDALTTVVAVQSLKKGDKVFVSDSGSPVTLAADMCLVKLKVGPGNPGPAEARSTSEGIGIEVWLPTHADWNQRIRNYGGGGFVGGGHIHAANNGATLATAVGSKFPAPVIAGMGYASGTTDAGQRWSQNGSFAFLPDGTLNVALLKDFSYRSLVEQALKTRAVVKLYYGKAPKYAYFDGHSTGGRQGWKVAQDYPELYDGYLIAAPAISSGSFGLNSFYPQVVMKTDLGYTSADPAFVAANFQQKVTEVNRRAVLACDKEGLGLLLDPFSCGYDPLKDGAALCTGVAGQGVVGSNSDEKTCVNAKEAAVINKLWYGITTDGSYDANQTASARSGVSLGTKQLWWSFPRGANWGAILGNVNNADRIALLLQDVRYAPSRQLNPAVDFVNASTSERDKWREIDHTALTDVFNKGIALQPTLGHPNTDRADLSRLRRLGRKVITYTGLAEDVIPPATSVNHYERVAAAMGGIAEVQKFVRLYLVPGKAHSSQGRGYTVASAGDASRNNTVPLPALPGAGNQTPSREQDQMFTALVDWVEKGTAPESITLVSRDKSVSYPVCVYPQKAIWNGSGSAKSAASYVCR
ncbi:tannase/feruloyl esterase family alpha/beta hydrolase [Polaromonas sp. P1-6]|nr:tannase/feruloyl esterase family alpha/beta hydrolase [Polaromonas sp. P1-6]